MFESFSKQYYKFFSVVFNVWVFGWIVINVFSLIMQYSSYFIYSTNDTSVQIASWFVNLISIISGLTVGIVLALMMNGTKITIKKRKAINSIELMIGLVIFYYIFPSTLSLFASILNSETNSIQRTIIFFTAWITPSLVMMVFHLIYLYNLKVYNFDLKNNPESLNIETTTKNIQ
jgi:hypothetical protein